MAGAVNSSSTSRAPASGAGSGNLQADFNAAAQSPDGGGGITAPAGRYTFGTVSGSQASSGTSGTGSNPLAGGAVSYGDIASRLQSGGDINSALGLGNLDATQAGKLGSAIKTAEEKGARGFDGDTSSFSAQDLDALKGNDGLLDELRAKGLGQTEETSEEDALSEETALGEEATDEAAAAEPAAEEAAAGAAPAGAAPAGGAPAGGEAAGGAEEGGLEGKDLNGDGKVDEKDKEILEMLKKAVEASGGDPNDPAALQKALDEYSGGDGKIDESDMAKLKEAAGGSDSTSSDSEGEGSDTLSSFANSNDPLAALTG
jgi:hypothetical protein